MSKRVSVLVMPFDVPKLVGLLSQKHKSREEKVALVLLIKQLAIDGSLQTDIDTVLTKLVDALTPAFIINMLIKPDAPSVLSKGQLVCVDAATWLLETILSSCPELIHKFASSIDGLLVCLMQHVEDATDISAEDSIGTGSPLPSRLNLVISMFKLIFLSDPSNSQLLNHIIVTILTKFAAKSCKRPIVILEILGELSTLSGGKSQIKLDSPCSSGLRSVSIQCLHGAAPEVTRDRGLQYIHQILCCNSIISPSWTVEDTGNDIGKAHSTLTVTSLTHLLTRSLALLYAGKFVLLLISIMRGELHLLYEEILCKYDTSEVRESKTAAASSSYVESAYANVSKNIGKRSERIYAVIDTCCNLMDTILLLLIGDEEGELTPIWSQLPGKIIGSIQSIVNNGIISEMFDFVTQVSGIDDRKGEMKAVTRMLHSVGKWMMEDDELLMIFLDKLPFILLIAMPYVDNSDPVVIDYLLIVIQYVLVIVERYSVDDDPASLQCRERICSIDKLFPLLLRVMYYHMHADRVALLLPTLEVLIVLMTWKLGDLKILLRSKESHESIDTVVYLVFSNGCNPDITLTRMNKVVSEYLSSQEWSHNDSKNELLCVSQQYIDLVSQIM